MQQQTDMLPLTTVIIVKRAVGVFVQPTVKLVQSELRHKRPAEKLMVAMLEHQHFTTAVPSARMCLNINLRFDSPRNFLAKKKRRQWKPQRLHKGPFVFPLNCALRSITGVIPAIVSSLDTAATPGALGFLGYAAIKTIQHYISAILLGNVSGESNPGMPDRGQERARRLKAICLSPIGTSAPNRSLC